MTPPSPVLATLVLAACRRPWLTCVSPPLPAASPHTFAASLSPFSPPSPHSITSLFSVASTLPSAVLTTSRSQDDHILIYDKAENNALLDSDGDAAWSALYSISEKKVRALNVVTNSFCAFPFSLSEFEQESRKLTVYFPSIFSRRWRRMDLQRNNGTSQSASE